MIKRCFKQCILLSFILLQSVPGQFSNVSINYFGQTPPGEKAVVFSPDFICKPGTFIQNCCFSQDGKEFIYVLSNSQWSSSTIMYTKYDGANWSEPAPLAGTGSIGSVPCFSYDGKDIYMILYQYNGSASADVYVCHRTGERWSDPVKLADCVNSNKQEWEVCISKNNTLYFSSDRTGGYGDMDVCTAELVDGNFTNFKNLGSPINTSSLDECPFIAPDESFMVFNDWKTNPRFAGNNLYISYHKPDGSWTNPKDLGANINTNLLDIYPYITPDGKYLMFTRRDGSFSAGSSRLYWAQTKFVDSLMSTNFEPYCKYPISNKRAKVDNLFTFQIADSIFYDDDINDVLTYSVTGLPDWMSYDQNTRTISGTPKVRAGGKYITITATDLSGAKALAQFTLTVSAPTDVENEHTSIPSFKLNQNYPNPFNPETTISYTIDKDTYVELKVFDILGSEKITLINGEQLAGLHQIKFNTMAHTEINSGIYFYRLQLDNLSETKKMVVLK